MGQSSYGALESSLEHVSEAKWVHQASSVVPSLPSKQAQSELPGSHYDNICTRGLHRASSFFHGFYTILYSTSLQFQENTPLWRELLCPQLGKWRYGEVNVKIIIQTQILNLKVRLSKRDPSGH